LAGHVQVFAELAERLPVLLTKKVQQRQTAPRDTAHLHEELRE
jgi:hypothetical protein